jgi:hypothetical protein
VVVLIIAWFVARSFRPMLVVIRTDPPGATIRVNGEVRGSSDLQLRLRAGAYQIAAQKDGFQPAAGSLVVKRGSPAALNLILQALAPAVPTLSALLATLVTAPTPLEAAPEAEAAVLAA